MWKVEDEDDDKGIRWKAEMAVDGKFKGSKHTERERGRRKFRVARLVKRSDSCLPPDLKCYEFIPCELLSM
jgi:hypothetical protein